MTPHPEVLVDVGAEETHQADERLDLLHGIQYQVGVGEFMPIGGSSDSRGDFFAFDYYSQPYKRAELIEALRAMGIRWSEDLSLKQVKVYLYDVPLEG